MNTPPLLLGMSLIYWGWHTGRPAFALIAACAFEASRLLPWRWDLETRLPYRVWDLCAVLFMAALVLVYAAGSGPGIFYGVERLLPLLLFPIMLAQAYGPKRGMELRVFFLLLRKKRDGGIAGTRINISYAYMAVCILSASVTDLRTPLFFGGLSLLSAWALWSVRSPRFSPLTWGTFFLCSLVTGHGIGLGLHGLQGILEQKFVDLYAGYLIGDMDPFKARTAIGDIGTLKLSNGIFFRLGGGKDRRGELLLTQAAYNVYRGSTWLAIQAPFKPLFPESRGGRRLLRKDSASWTVSAWLERGKGVLALPWGACQLEGPSLARLSGNPMGAVRIEEGPYCVTYRVQTGQGAALQGPPDANDLRIPPGPGPVLSEIAAGLGLDKKSKAGVVRAVKRYFGKNFTYSLDLEGTRSGADPLQDFLLRTRSGHCEYFATATTLLLRRAGIPARYAVGYLAHEYSRLEKSFVVRGRDAHAWALARVDGKWVVVDTTPDVWVQRDARNASFLESLLDLGSRVYFLYSEWSWSEERGPFRKSLLALLISLILFLAWKITSRAGAARVDGRRGMEKKASAETDFSRIEERFRGFGLGRHPWETPWQCLERVRASGLRALSTDSLPPVLALYYRHRFDPAGISSREKLSLKGRVEAWLMYNERKKYPAAERGNRG